MPRYCGQCGYDTTSVPVRPGGRLCPECGATTRGVRARGSLARAVIWTCAPCAGCLAVAATLLILGFVVEAGPAIVLFMAGLGALVWGVLIGIAALVQTPSRAARFWPREQARSRVALMVLVSLILDAAALTATVLSVASFALRALRW